MHISGAAGHDPTPEDVRFYRLSAGCCLSIGGIDLYGSLDGLIAVMQRAHELAEVERQRGIPVVGGWDHEPHCDSEGCWCCAEHEHEHLTRIEVERIDRAAVDERRTTEQWQAQQGGELPTLHDGAGAGRALTEDEWRARNRVRP